MSPFEANVITPSLYGVADCVVLLPDCPLKCKLEHRIFMQKPRAFLIGYVPPIVNNRIWTIRDVSVLFRDDPARTSNGYVCACLLITCTTR